MYLRYHHLDQLSMLAEHFSNWKQSNTLNLDQAYLLPLGISDLSRNAEIGYSFILEEAKLQGRFIMLDIQTQTFKPTSETYWHDYAGSQGEYVQQYVKEMNACMQHLLLSDPETKVGLGYSPDGICRSCQVKAPREDVGSHCIAEMGNLGDYVWEKALDKIQEPYFIKSPHIPEYTTKIGVLRKLADHGVLDLRYDEAITEIINDQERLLNEGFLFKESSTGDLKLHSGYYGAERH